MATSTTAPRTTTFESADPHAIELFLAGAYGARMRIRSADQSRFLRHRRTDAGAFAIDVVEQSADRTFAVDPMRTVVVTRVTTARIERACRLDERRYDAGDLFLAAHPDAFYTCRWYPGEIANCVIEPALLARVAATAPGRRGGPIGFTSLEPVSPAASAQWWATRSYVANLLGDPELVTPLVLTSAAQLLAAATLTTFPNTALTEPTIEDRRDASTPTVRRAVAYIDSHAGSDIGVADIAAAANVSIRAVQLAFRRHLGTTPMAYLRQVRLDHVRQALIDADPTTATVSAIAASWGFANHSRFTATYRATYGVLPSAVLRGA